ncbi:MAG: ABC transporter ATP-binding protein [Spirochaetia bacterium]|nr:ABC transporter ATP-binding protein [Spirochaetia bacterium]
MPEYVIEAELLEKSYKNLRALRGVSLSVHPGEIFGFLGPNGAGKTTFVKILLNFVRKTGGNVTVLGTDPAHLDRKRVGYLPERVSIHPFLSAREFLQSQARLAAIPSKQVGAEVARVLERVKMTDRADDRVSTFSKGMMQRIGVAQAVLGAPDLLILDEPGSGLDPIGMLEMREIIQGERDRGATVFLNSHQLLEVEKTCDRMAILHKGQLVAQGRRDDLGAHQGITAELDSMPAAVVEYAKKVDPKCSIQGPVIDITFKDKEEERMFPARIVEKGGRILKYAQKREGLEELFRRLIQEAEGATAAGGKS